MTIKLPLLDFIAMQMRCMYLSDLQFLSGAQRKELARKLEKLNPQDIDIREWNDALAYLVNARPSSTAEAAKKRLVYLLLYSPSPARR